MLVLEPWGMALELAPGQQVEVIGRGSSPGRLHLEHRSDALIVWSWPTSTIEVQSGADVLFKCDVAVPGVPEGSTVSRFLKGILGLK